MPHAPTPAPPRRPELRRALPWVLAFSVAWVVVITLGISLGAVHIPIGRVWTIIFAKVTSDSMPAGATSGQISIVWELRLPRVLIASFVGAGLTVCGVAIQALVRNVLADPYILGVSSGASVGAAFVLLFGSFASIGVWALTGAAFLGALGAMLAVFGLSVRGSQLSPLRLLLTGTALAYAFSAFTSFLTYFADPRADRTVLYWLLGGLGRSQWSLVPVPLVAVGVGSAVLLVRGRDLNALSLGDDTASALGLNVERFRIMVFVLTAIVTGAVVSVSGAIGFVGLILPHVARLIVGADHRRVLMVGIPLGATFLVVADLVARVVLRPEEIPVGIITAIVGVPVFLLLARRRLTAMPQ